MSRPGRIKSDIGIYHVVLRGVNQQAIFHDEEDYKKLLYTFSDIKKVSGFTIYAYCIMENHCHFLIKEGDEGLDKIFIRFGPKYVYWYNRKYNRVGHLFQNRFWSEPIKNEKHFVAVLRYIHQNPIKAGICADISNYKWSSFREYLANPYIIDIYFTLGIISKNDLIKLHLDESNDKYLDCESMTLRATDSQAKDIIQRISNCCNVSEFQDLSSSRQRTLIKKIRYEGISIRQISRLTGISKGVVERI